MPENDQLIASSHIDLDRRIRERAHQIWQARTNGANGDGSALEDWLQAEREVLGDSSVSSAQNRGTTVGNAHTPDRTTVEQMGEA